MSENQFKPSAWTIRLKLISMISIIIIFGLSSMIFLASGFFKDDSERRIQENNLQLASIIGQKVENEFYSIAYKIHNIQLNKFLREAVENFAKPKDIPVENTAPPTTNTSDDLPF